MYFITFILKNLWRRPARSIFATGGVALAVGAVVTLMGIPRGLDESRQQPYEGHDVDPAVVRAGSTERLATSIEQMARTTAWTTAILAVLIGTMGVSNTMTAAVLEQTREIGILRAIGWRKSRIMRMILGESLLLGIAGSVVGSVAGVLALRWLSTHSRGGYVDGKASPEVLLLGLAIALVIGLVGGLYPAYRGANLSPTEAIRHE